MSLPVPTAIGQEITVGGQVYRAISIDPPVWDDITTANHEQRIEALESGAAAGTVVTQTSTTPPANPVSGMSWYIIDNDQEFIYVVEDGETTGQWIEIGGSTSSVSQEELTSLNGSRTFTASQLQARLDAGLATVVSNDVSLTAPLNIPSGTNLTFLGGTLRPAAGIKAVSIVDASDVTIHGITIFGVQPTSGASSVLAEHGIDIIRCSRVKLYTPRIENVGGVGVRLDACNDTDVYDLITKNTGFLGYIAIECNRDRLHSGYVQDSKDPFSVQSKGSTDSLIDNIVVTNPHSCGVIMNTNQDGGTNTPQIRGRIGKVTILGESTETPIGTQGGVLYQGTDGSIGEVYMTNNTKIPQVSVASGTDNLQIGKITVETNTSIGVDGAAGVGTVVIQSLIAKGNNDRAARFRSGRIHILGGDIRENGTANVPNIEFLGWDYFIISGVTFERTSTGASKNNIRLSASTGRGLITGNTFMRNGQPDVITETGEFRTDCPNVSIHGNHNCFVQVTTGWVERFEIKDGILTVSGYSRSSAPTTGTWVKGDRMLAQPSAVGEATEYVCIAAPSTWVSAAVTI